MNWSRLLSVAVVTLSVPLVSPATAAVIHPVGVTTDVPTDVAGLVVDNLINGSGLALVNGSITDANIASVTHDGQVFGNGSNESTYTVSDPSRPTLRFDLGGSFEVRSAYIWNYHDTDGFFGSTLSGNGTSEATVSFELGGSPVGASVVINPAESPTRVGQLSLPSAHLLSSAGVLADTVIVSLDERFPNGDRVGLGEVRFSTTAPVPEPSSLIYMVAAVAYGCLRRTV